MRKGYILFFALVFILGGCGFKNQNQAALGNQKPQGGNNEQGEKPEENKGNEADDNGGVMKFASEAELRDFIENSAGGSGKQSSYLMRDMAVNDALGGTDLLWSGMATESTKEMANSPAGTGGSDEYSKTNIQVEGVDEADIVKTDGEFIYAVVKNDLFIAKAYPAEKAEIIAKIEFKSRPQEMYVAGNRLSIFGQDTDFTKSEKAKIWPGRSQFTFFKIFDISDPKNPKQVKDLDFEGSYRDSRLIGDYVYLVTQNNSYRIMDGQTVLPRVLEGGKAIEYACAGADKCVWPDVYYFDLPYRSYQFTAVNAVNFKDIEAKVDSDIYLMDSNQSMFVSLDNIYITYTKYVSESELEMQVMREVVYPRLSSSDRERIEKIESVENYILSREEKLMKIGYILENYTMSLTDEEQDSLEEEIKTAMAAKYRDIAKEMEKTVIHKIAINKGELEYLTSGEVTGQVLNQFSMDENNGYFRIATTKNRTWSQYIENEDVKLSYSNLYVLDKDLKKVGAVEKLAPDERIYSVRFMQDRAYMVTFKQTDPLFVIDLSIPTDPKVLGELKIPGFSNYLHPYDDDHLIGIGKDTKENQWGGVTTGGVKLSLFDVSDVANPKEIDTYILGEAGSDSIALHDHKAFLFDKKKNLLVIPASVNEYVGSAASTEYRRSRLTFSGAAVFKIDETGFEYRGGIDHSDGGKTSPTDYWGGVSYYDNSVKRSLYIESVLYTFSNQYLKMNKIDDLKEVNMIRLKKDAGGDDDFTVIN